MIPYSARPTHFSFTWFSTYPSTNIYVFFFARLKSYLQVMRADRSPAACNRVIRLIIYYMDRIFRVLHVTGWQHITGHLRSME